MNLERIITMAREMKASDIHISEGRSLIFRINGALQEAPFQPGNKMRELIFSMMGEERRERINIGSDLDFAIQTSDGNRQRVNVFWAQGKMAATIRILNNNIPTPDELKLPNVLEELIGQPEGLILVTGPAGSGKSTTLAAMINLINRRRAEHIITIEDPIEYVYTPERALIHQREVGQDVSSFADALRSALREDPDVIMVGEMKDYETISSVLTAAETGHLVLCALPTAGAAQTIERIIDVCPPQAKNQVRTQLSGVLKGVVTQCLIPTSDMAGRVVATEVLVGTDAALNLIRENKCHQMKTIMQSGADYGMHTLNGDLLRLVQNGQISRENAIKYSNDRKDLEQYM